MAAESLLLLQNRLAGSLKINWAMRTRGLEFPAYLSCLPIERRWDNNADLSRRRRPGDKSSEVQVLTALLKTALCFCQMLSAHEQLRLFPAARAAAGDGCRVPLTCSCSCRRAGDGCRAPLLHHHFYAHCPPHLH